MPKSLDLVNKLLDTLRNHLGESPQVIRYIITTKNEEDQIGPKAIYHRMRYKIIFIQKFLQCNKKN